METVPTTHSADVPHPLETVANQLREQLGRPLKILYVQKYHSENPPHHPFDQIFKTYSVNFNTFSAKNLDIIYVEGMILLDLASHNPLQIRQLLNQLANDALICMIGKPAPSVHTFALNSHKVFRQLLESFAYVDKISTDALPQTQPKIASKKTLFTQRIKKPLELIFPQKNRENMVFFASNHYWYANQRLNRFESWTELAHERAIKQPINLKRYYFSSEKFLKLCYFSNEKAQPIRDELVREIVFLTEQQPIIQHQPHLLGFHLAEDYGWLVREKIPGMRLSSAIVEHYPYNPKKVILSILEQLAQLEDQGLYHTDLHTGNVLLLADDQAMLIDYGAIRDTPRDIHAPHKHVLTSFFSFLYEVSQGALLDNKHFSPALINKKYYPVAYHHWIEQLLSVSFKTWSFSFMLKLWQGETELQPEDQAAAQQLQLWLEQIEEKFNQSLFKLNKFERKFIKKLSKELKKTSNNTTIQNLWNRCFRTAAADSCKEREVL